MGRDMHVLLKKNKYKIINLLWTRISYEWIEEPYFTVDILTVKMSTDIENQL